MVQLKIGFKLCRCCRWNELQILESKWHLQFYFNYTFQFQFQILQFWFWAILQLELKAILIPTLELVPTQVDRASADMVFDVMLFQICYITAFLA